MGKLRRAAKGTGTLLKQKRTWAIKWVENGRRRYTGGFIRKEDAEAVRASIALNLAHDRPGLPEQEKKPAPLFREVAEDWLAARRAEDHRNQVDDENRWRRHLAPRLDALKLDAVDGGFLAELLASLRAGVKHRDPDRAREALSPASAQRAIYLLSSFYRWAEQQKLIDRNPVRDFLKVATRKQKESLRSTHRPEDVPFLGSKDDVATVYRELAALPKWQRGISLAFALGALAGLRPGEAVGLRWADVDLLKAKITVRQQVRHGKATVPKSGRARSVPAVPGLLKVLREARAADPRGDLVCAPMRAGDKQKYLSPATVGEELATVLARLGLPALTLYQASRHTFASLWVIAGLDIFLLSKILGHAAVTTTARYAHLRDQLAPAVAAAADVKLSA